uniref:Uncharacterized protein n=1 Tax=Leersia perrieri TaxID=77586 RepID=A0A0D9VJC2_9ORYZ
MGRPMGGIKGSTSRADARRQCRRPVVLIESKCLPRRWPKGAAARGTRRLRCGK